MFILTCLNCSGKFIICLRFLKIKIKIGIKLIKRNILQSNGILIKFKNNPKVTKAPRPIPKRMRFLSRKSSDSFASFPSPRPIPQQYMKNNKTDLFDELNSVSALNMKFFIKDNFISKVALLEELEKMKNKYEDVIVHSQRCADGVEAGCYCNHHNEKRLMRNIILELKDKFTS